jgi:hypothetical protein
MAAAPPRADVRLPPLESGTARTCWILPCRLTEGPSWEFPRAFTRQDVFYVPIRRLVEHEVPIAGFLRVLNPRLVLPGQVPEQLHNGGRRRPGTAEP